jgi:hypothetical protein
MEKTQEIEKPGFFAKIKHRLARGLVVTGAFYLIFMIILIATNRTKFDTDVFILWVLVPDIYLSIFAAIIAELSWSASAFIIKREMSAAAGKQTETLKEEGQHD